MGSTRTPRQMLRKLRKNTRRLKAFARRSSLSTTVRVVVVAVVALVVPKRRKRRLMTSCEISVGSFKLAVLSHFEQPCISTTSLLSPAIAWQRPSACASSQRPVMPLRGFPKRAVIPAKEVKKKKKKKKKKNSSVLIPPL